MLILFAPGAPRERYFEGLAELATLGEKPSEEDMAEFYRRTTRSGSEVSSPGRSEDQACGRCR